MTATEIADALRDRFGDKVLEVHDDERSAWARVERDVLVDACRFLRDDARTDLTMCHSVTAVDRLQFFEIVIHLYSVDRKHGFAIKTDTPSREDATCPSVASVWPGADWHEREAYDMFGVIFEGHPNLRRILLPGDWDGYPLRKDEGNPLEYHGIPGIAMIRGLEDQNRAAQTAQFKERYDGGIALDLGDKKKPAKPAKAAKPAAGAAPKAPGAPKPPGAPRPPGAPKAPPMPGVPRAPAPPKPPGAPRPPGPPKPPSAAKPPGPPKPPSPPSTDGGGAPGSDAKGDEQP